MATNALPSSLNMSTPITLPPGVSLPPNFTMPLPSLNSTIPFGIDGVLQIMGDFFMSAFKDQTYELTSLLLSQYDPRLIPCRGDLLILTKSSTIPSNGACPRQWAKLSCTCVKQINAATTHEWIFRVAATNTTIDHVPAELEASTSALPVNTLGQFLLLPYITKFRLLGESDTQPVGIAFDHQAPLSPDGTVSLVASATINLVEEVEIANLNFSSVNITDTFIPSSVTHVTFRNCGLTKLPSSFIFMRWTKLVSIDLSGNQLSSWYSARDTLPKPSSTFTSLNLAGNAFTSIPSSLLTLGSLQSLNFSHNPITNFTVSAPLFSYLSNLKTLTFDGIDSSVVTPKSCSSDRVTLKSAHNVNFCVETTNSATEAISSSASSSHNSSTSLYVGIASGLVVAVLVIAFFLVRKKRHHQQHSPKASSNTGDALDSPWGHGTFEIIQARDGHDNPPILQAPTQPIEVDPTLLNNPMIVRSRLNQKDMQVNKILKRGGSGVVFTGAYQGRQVAIKTLRREYTNNRKYLEGFLKEIALMASLQHPRIVEYIGCVWHSIQSVAVVVELMERGDLREVLQSFVTQHTPLTWTSDKTRFALHIAEGLQYLHTLSPKVIHRDLKSKNILVNTNLDAKLTDFGISREGRFEHTHMTAGIGTSFWIAPEVLAGLKYDERADIYSFGVVLSEIDTDDYPYWNDTEVEGDADDAQRIDRILRMVLTGKMRPRFSPDCPQMIHILANRCLETEPSKRPTATEIVQYLMPVVEAPVELRQRYLELTLT